MVTAVARSSASVSPFGCSYIAEQKIAFCNKCSGSYSLSSDVGVSLGLELSLFPLSS